MAPELKTVIDSLVKNGENLFKKIALLFQQHKNDLDPHTQYLTKEEYSQSESIRIKSTGRAARYFSSSFH